MNTFQKGDRVEVVSAGPENAGTEGQTGIVYYTEAEASGQIAVKGIDGRLREAVNGYRTYWPHQLRAV